MLVYPVSLENNIKPLRFAQNRKIFIKTKPDSFEPSFNGYNELVKKVVKTELKSDNAVEKTFNLLFEELTNNPKITLTPEINGIVKLYKERGLRGLMHEICVPESETGITELVKKSKEGLLTLAHDNNKPLFQIINLGRCGFWNSVFDNPTAKRDTRLIFSTSGQNFLFEFAVNKKGGFEICQTKPNDTIVTIFHASTGKLKQVTHNPINGKQETTYYYKDGSKNSLKTFFLQEPPIW